LPARPAARRPRQTVGGLFAAAQRAPLTCAKTLTKGGPVIVLAPHPDDETLGCGGLLATCAEAGIPAYVFTLTDGAFSHPQSAWSPSKLAGRRSEEMIRALRKLGVRAGALRQFALPDGKLLLNRSGREKAGERIGKFAQSVNAKAIFVTWGHDPHPDHIAAALIAARIKARAPRVEVFHYPVRGRFLAKDIAITSGPRRPVRVNVGKHLAAKRAAMACYKTQTAPTVSGAGVEFRFAKREVARYLTQYEYFFRV
jgi:LmbE family N-acetylglucosaminyl deacetylase